MTDLLQPTSPEARKHAERLMSVYRGKPTTPIGTQELTCEKHGTFTSTGHRLELPGKPTRDIWSDCVDCKREARELEQEEAAQRQRFADRAAMADRIYRAGIPKRFQARTMDTFNATTPEQVKALTTARDFVEQFPDNCKRGASLVLSGMPGTGKSHIAAAIMLGVVGKYSTRYLTFMEMVQEIRGTWRKGSDRGEGDVLDELGNQVDLLVIDEIGVQYGTEGEQTLLFAVLDQRYRNMRSTILLTNQDRAGFRGYVGDRVMDRLTETAKWVPFQWESYRATARKEAAES